MDDKPKTGSVNARLWGVRARDWADFQEVQHRPAYMATLDRLAQDGSVVLDVGCGSGMAAEIAARKGASVCGIDAAEALLAIARERVPNGDFRVGDMEDLPYPDARFDLITAFNAVQYAGNPLRVLAEMRRVAKPDAKIVIMTWGPPENMPAATLVKALGPLLPPPPPGAPGPFALSDGTALGALAAKADLKVLEIIDVDSPFEYPGLEIALRGWASSGVAARASEHSGQEAVDNAHRTALVPFEQGDGRYHIGAMLRCFILARPSDAPFERGVRSK